MHSIEALVRSSDPVDRSQGLRELREALNLTRGTAARMAGISANTVARWEDPKLARPQADKLNSYVDVVMSASRHPANDEWLWGQADVVAVARQSIESLITALHRLEDNEAALERIVERQELELAELRWELASARRALELALRHTERKPALAIRLAKSAATIVATGILTTFATTATADVMESPAKRDPIVVVLHRCEDVAELPEDG